VIGQFDGANLAALRDEEEVEIETTGRDGAVHRTIIWVVVDDRGRALIRSYLGAGARWYREVTARPECRIHTAGRVIEARAIPATDAERVAACSEGFRTKYARQRSTPLMIARYLETTLELVPR
jgi:deazaflavin-dependent oxidoreductase (nitroreductase family)